MKKLVMSLIAVVAVFAMVACGDYNRDSNDVTTIDSHDDSHNVTYVRESGTTIDDNGTESTFKTVCNIGCSNVTAEGGYITINSETAIDGLPDNYQVRVQVGNQTVSPTVVETANDTILISTRFDLTANDTGSDITRSISVYATDGTNRVDICAGICVQPSLDTNSSN